jgi:hypothetical protein
MDIEIKAIIEKNLPAQVGEVLKQRLEQAEKDAATVSFQADSLRQKDRDITALEERTIEYQKFDIRNAELEKREKILEQTERNLKIEKLTYELTAERDKTQFTKDVALGLVRNIEYRKTVFDAISEPHRDQYGNTIFHDTSKTSNEENKAL